MFEVKPGQVISLKDDGFGFISSIRGKVSGKKLYVLSILNPLGGDLSDCNMKLLVIPKSQKGKHYIWTPRLSVVGKDNIIFHGDFDLHDLDESVISKAKQI